MDEDRRLLIACLDLTSLGDEDDEAIAALCDRAALPVPGEPDLRVAAVCVWPRFASFARERLDGTGVAVACATGGFPVPDGPRHQRLHEIRAAIDGGATEVDVPINRFLLDEPDELRRDLEATREAAGTITWKAILETGVLAPQAMRLAGQAAIEAGADFLKSSTGAGPPGVSPEAGQAMAELVAAADHPVGLKLSGGIRGAGQAANYLRLIRAVLGRGWPNPATFRIGASALLESLLA
jgi:deoxyribose-phosphate aldolase